MSSTLSKQQRQAAGQSRRKQISRSGHALWLRKDGRRSALEILQRTAVGRVPHLLALKYERMAESPFGYFRGAAPVMAFDLGHQPHTGIITQICGDAHVRNLGAYATPDGSLTFDINDFDETLRAPFEWDVKRLATSIHLTARETGETEAACHNAVRIFLRRYRKSLHRFAAMPVLELARFQVHRRTGLAAVSEVFWKAERSTPLHLRDQLTEPESSLPAKGKGKGKAPKRAQATGDAPEEPRIFRSAPPLLERLTPEQAGVVLASLEAYRETIQPERRHHLSRYRPVDVAFKVVGTGSIGLRDYCIYLEGNGPDDPLFLQIKQEVASAWERYLGELEAPLPQGVSQGERVVNGQRAMQIQSDPFLGYTHIEGRNYLVRQLNDHKGSVNLGHLDAEALAHYADLCGELLARGHARSGDPDALAGYIGHGNPFDKSLAEFARRYADQTERDWQALRRARAKKTKPQRS